MTHDDLAALETAGKRIAQGEYFDANGARFINAAFYDLASSHWQRLIDAVRQRDAEIERLSIESKRYQKLAYEADKAKGGNTVLVGMEPLHDGTWHAVLTAGSTVIEGGMDGTIQNAIQVGVEAAILTFATIGVVADDHARIVAAINVVLPDGLFDTFGNNRTNEVIGIVNDSDDDGATP